MQNIKEFFSRFFNKPEIKIITLTSTTRREKTSLARELTTGAALLLDISSLSDALRDNLIAFLEGVCYDRGQLIKIDKDIYLLSPDNMPISQVKLSSNGKEAKNEDNSKD